MPREGDGAAARLSAADDAAGRSVVAQSKWRRLGDAAVSIVHRDKYGLITFAAYFALSFLFFGRSLIGHFSDRYIGIGCDPGSFIFVFGWWPYALAHHLNPFDVDVAWAPVGFSLARSSAAPLVEVVMIPIAAAFGAIPAYNIAILLCPALAAWTAFILCRYVTKSYWPSLAGGYIFGFSPYMLGELLGHLHMVTVFLLPVSVYLVLRFLNSEIGRREFVVLFTLLLVGQFLFSLEVFATMTAAGGVALLMAWWRSDSELRSRIRALIPPLVISYIATTILMSPYLYFFFAASSTSMPSYWVWLISARPLSLFAAARTNIFGGWRVFRALAMAPNIWEAGEYIGIPLFIVFCSFAYSRWREFAPKLLVVFTILLTIATFGPVLRLGRILLLSPWFLVTFMPLGKLILPARLSVYMFLALAIIFAMWLSERARSYATRVVMGTLVIVSLLPNLSMSFWTMPAAIPAFFRNGVYKRYLSRGENVVILPFGQWGDEALWQAQTRMYFNAVGDNLSVIPPLPMSFAQYPIVHTFYNPVEIPDAAEQLKAFLVQKDIGAVIVADSGKHLWRSIPSERITTFRRVAFSSQTRAVIHGLFSSLGVTPIEVGGVTLYRVPLAKLQPYKSINPRVLQERVAAVRMAKLVEAAHKYAERGLDLRKLNPYRAEQLGLLPPHWIGGIYIYEKNRRAPIQNELILEENFPGAVGIGLFGPHRVLADLAREYGPYARDVKMFSPNLRTAEASDSVEWSMVMDFTPARLAKAVPIARKAEAENSKPLLQNPTPSSASRN